MDWINHTLAAAGALLFVALLLSATGQRIGLPALLVFLAVGLVATELPGVPRQPVDTATAALIGNLALAVILLDGGLRTSFATFRMVAAPALVLATVGVVLTAALVGAIAVVVLGLSWPHALLLGAVIGSTDAAAVFALLRAGGVRLNERVAATLEVESGINDPMAVFLTIALIELIAASASSPAALAWTFVLQLGVGLAGAFVLGRLLAEIVARVRLSEGLYALLIHSGGLLVFTLTNLLGGSGFLAIYLTGMLIARRRVHAGEDVLRASDGLAWLAQAGMFLILGLFAQIDELARVATPALLVGAGLLFIARPLAVAACLVPFRYAAREIAFIGWVGLRGAVPIVLALFPLLAGLPQAAALFHIVFFSVLLSLLLQGTTLARGARLARVDAPAASFVLSSAGMEGADPPRELVQLRVRPDSHVVDRRPDEIDLPLGARLVEVMRDRRVVEVERLRAGDAVAVLASADTVPDLEELFGAAPAGGEWSLDANATLGDLRDYYGVTIGADAAQTVADFVRARLRGRAASGDRIALGRITLTVRQASGGTVRRVGLRVERK